jgi:hypothetical protein
MVPEDTGLPFCEGNVKKMVPKDVLIPRTCECVSSHSKGDFADKIKLRDFAV